MPEQKIAIIIGAGPAGLTAAYELLQKTDIKPIIFEKLDQVGGIARTVNYKGYRIDIGPHRFFSKSQKVLGLWESLLPLQGALSKDDIILHRQISVSDKPGAPDPAKTDKVMLFKNRLTRIFFLKKFFNYPISLSLRTIINLGLVRVFKMGFSYIRYAFFPIKDENTLEDFFINRFGKELYLTFFKDYTEKVWGVPCHSIPKEWGAQRVKGLSIAKAIAHALRSIFSRKSADGLSKRGETSLTESFLYPKLGAGQIYEEMACRIKAKGGEIYLNSEVIGFELDGDKIISLEVKNLIDQSVKKYQADYFFSSMPIKNLVSSLPSTAPTEVRRVADGLVYRDFLTVGLLLKKMMAKNDTKIPAINDLIPDNWIYIQEREAKMGRLDIFNNFSVYLLKDDSLVWLGAEYFCNQGDELWNKSNKAMADFAMKELAAMGLASSDDLLDYTVIRQPKAYPAYFGTYNEFEKVRAFTDGIENLFLIGRNGLHRYNNMDHSILSAMVAVDNVVKGITNNDNIWNINVEESYHEEK